MRSADEARGMGAPRGRKKKPASAQASMLWTYHPTVDERKVLAQGTYGPLEALDTIAEHLLKGSRTTFGYKAENGSFYCLLREAGDDWEKCKAISAWHSDLGKSITTLGYYLAYVNPSWPATHPTSTQQEFDW